MSTDNPSIFADLPDHFRNEVVTAVARYAGKRWQDRVLEIANAVKMKIFELKGVTRRAKMQLFAVLEQLGKEYGFTFAINKAECTIMWT